MRPALALFPLYSRFRSPTTLGPCSACRKSGNKTFQCKQFASLNRCKVAPRIGGESDESLKCNLLKKAAGAGTTWVKNAPTLGRREGRRGTDKLCTSFLLDSSLGGDRELVAHDVSEAAAEVAEVRMYCGEDYSSVALSDRNRLQRFQSIDIAQCCIGP